MPVVGLTGPLAPHPRRPSRLATIAVCIFLFTWIVHPAASQVLSYAHVDETRSPTGGVAGQIDAGFNLYWSLSDVNQQLRSGRAVDLLILSGRSSWLSTNLAIAQGVLADHILLVPTDMGTPGATATLSLPKVSSDLSANPVTEKSVQIHLLRLPSGASTKVSNTVRAIDDLANGPEGALAFVCSQDPLKDLPQVLAEKLAPRNWGVLYVFQNCLALWHGMPDNTANKQRNEEAIEERKATGYRIVTLVVNGSSLVTERTRPGQTVEASKSADKLGDLMLAETLEQHWQLEESQAKYESALTSTDETVLQRATDGIDRVLPWRTAYKWFSRFVRWFSRLILLVIAILLFLAARRRLRSRRGRMVLRVESLVASGAIPDFAMHVQRKELELSQLVGETLLADAGEMRIFAPPASQALKLDSLPSLSVSKVDVKSVLVWAQALWEYFGARRLMVWVGELSNRTMIRASIESGWTSQGDWMFEADTEEEAAWQLVTWAAGHDAADSSGQ
jgi:hypothetical protein